MDMVSCMPQSPSFTDVKQRLDGLEEAEVEQNVFSSAHSIQRNPGLQELALHQP